MKSCEKWGGNSIQAEGFPLFEGLYKHISVAISAKARLLRDAAYSHRVSLCDMVVKVLILWLVGCQASLMLYSNSTTQSVFFASYNFALSSVASHFILIHLAIQLEASGAVPVLLISSKASAPYAYLDSTGQLQMGAQEADLSAYAFQKTDSYLQLNTSGLHVGANLYLGVMMPERPMLGIGLLLTAEGHGKNQADGDVCPGNCSARGTCQEGLCKCEKPWGDIDCSLRISYLDIGQSYDLIVGSSTYRHFTTIYVYSSAVHLNLKSLQGNAQVYISFGK